MTAPAEHPPERRSEHVPERPRFLSEADCQNIAQRLARAAVGGGLTSVLIQSQWTGNVRWARNQISTSGETRNNYVFAERNLRGAENDLVLFNETTDAALVAAARRAERLAKLVPQSQGWDLILQETLEPATTPVLFSDATYQLDATHRAQAAIALTQAAAAAGVLSAGYMEVSAHSLAAIDSDGRSRYFPYTWASYTVTVRDPRGTGSGWAGVDWPDWSRVDTSQLSAVALDKCLTSRNPVAIEPGRYMTILEPQAVGDFVGTMMRGDFIPSPMDRGGTETPDGGPRHAFFKSRGTEHPFTPTLSELGDQVMDERITISADPMDPELGFPPFDLLSASDWLFDDVFHPAIWVKSGVLQALAYRREYAIDQLGLATGLPNSGAFRMSGGDTSIAEMIATTKRGLLVTRLDELLALDGKSLLLRGFTRDGLWLIEDGRISKAVKNMVITESILFALNNIEQLGVPERIYSPLRGPLSLPAPAIVPPLKIRDFSFTALSEAI